MSEEKKKLKILIIDDEADLRELYKLRFEADNFEIAFAVDGEEAIQRIKDENPDLILLDIMMPKKSGMEVLKDIKENSLISSLPVIILTALPHSSIKEEAEKIGAVGYLVKSEVSPQQVLQIAKEKLGINI